MSGHKDRVYNPQSPSNSHPDIPSLESTDNALTQQDYHFDQLSGPSFSVQPSSSQQVFPDQHPSRPNEDSDYNFLDILSADMDFEQAYNMYTTLQQKNAISSIEQLEKVQMLNQQYVSTLASGARHPTQQQRAMVPQGLGQYSANSPFNFNLSSDPSPAPTSRAEDPNFNYHRTQILNGGVSKNYMFNGESQQSSTPSIKSESMKKRRENEEDFDQFFSNTESNALEKFLDNLANPAEEASLHFYNRPGAVGTDSPGQEFNDLFDLHTMNPIPMGNKGKMETGFGNRFQSFNQLNIQKSNSLPLNMSQQGLMEHETLKKELTEAFSHPHRDNTPPSNGSPNHIATPLDSKDPNGFRYQEMKRTTELITPPSSDNNESMFNFKQEKRNSESFSGDDEANGIKKRRRSSLKPLLSLEQKRLNHSHSEQKRRQMCKLAYERCLRLIIDIEAFNKLPATVSDSVQRKSKRARVNKDGLPNLSKHNALIRISNEIELIKNKNDALKAALEQRGIKDHLKFAPPVARDIN
ncbi:uncharacterized protein CANTADRAFT_300825 [Suhomyces tanzawaensis NRRL Y-17324]|uniref:Uncharacterized protein n=1 Tax=Suhomyces tanzawaensis NRRL Y-17324 TaxID=984487 RepID=A0A1E4SCG1_9ASCO|nr:uncharacterized protein CANTADRAFT_300825 [Suhomyces tanzawaensis NRRL Y-17324]ODV77210.1 hypothetical protein CANTADRAFT_300825 [Suhomyces tanzawaensis NRRL Y-17324]